jgi:hypothetical protein
MLHHARTCRIAIVHSSDVATAVGPGTEMLSSSTDGSHELDGRHAFSVLAFFGTPQEPSLSTGFAPVSSISATTR